MTPRQVLPYRMSQAEYRDPDFHRAQLEVRRRMRRWARRERMKRWLLSRETWIAAVALAGLTVALLYAFDAEGSERRRGVDGHAPARTGDKAGAELQRSSGQASAPDFHGEKSPKRTWEDRPAGIKPGRRLSDLSASSYFRSWLFKGLLFCLIVTGCLIVLEAVREFLLDDEDLGNVSPRREWR